MHVCLHGCKDASDANDDGNGDHDENDDNDDNGCTAANRCNDDLTLRYRALFGGLSGLMNACGGKWTGRSLVR